MNPLIFGKDDRQKVVGADVKNDTLYLYLANGNKTDRLKLDAPGYLLTNRYVESLRPGQLGGSNYFKYFVKRPSKQLWDIERDLKVKGVDTFRVKNEVEAQFIRTGITQFKGMNFGETSILSVDIETVGIKRDNNAFVLIIGNTYRSRGGEITKRMFTYRDYENQGAMLIAWCKWVREMDPDIVVGHNLFGFDLPYLAHIAICNNVKLYLGRDASPIKFDRNPRKFRKDGSQVYDYINARIFGREIVDTFFLSIKYDIGRKYDSYGLKAIIQHEGLIKEGRQFWDFSACREPWNYVDKWEQFKQYCADDSDDALALFDLMAPQFFYYTQSIPRTLQEIINTATGGQINSFMLRAYLQESKSIPAATDREHYEGAISIGNPGIYKNVHKVDVASLYPSIMLQYNVYDPKKDPERKFLEMVEYFTKERLENKRLAKETGNRYYKDLSEGQKIVINSAYGFMGTGGLQFNYPDGAALVTGHGRKILNQAITWAQSKGYRLVNADTDSISYETPFGSSIEQHLEEINALCPSRIKWEQDGTFDSFVVVKAKNYAMKSGDKVTIKGSGLKATMKEKALAEFLEGAIQLLLNGNGNLFHDLYMSYVQEIITMPDISRWTSKKTITEAVLNPKRKNEKVVLDALNGKQVQEGDKIRVFYDTKDTLCLEENFTGLVDRKRLFAKLYATAKILEPVCDLSMCLNYSLKRNEKSVNASSRGDYKGEASPQLRT